MKFVHIADMHFDSPFTSLNRIENLGNIRRLEQRDIFKQVIEYIKKNNIPYFFISGDLYEHKYVKQSTIEYIDKLFRTILDTKIFISPGNHDPYLKTSYYNKYKWSSNVHIFNNEIEKICYEDVNIYGYGFSDFYCKNSDIQNIIIDDKTKLNILVVHSSLDATKQEEMQYNSLNKKELEKLGFDYIALGHIHKNNYNNTQKIIYPGSLISLAFDELGQHGMVVGNIEKNNLITEFIPINQKEFIQLDFNIEQINSEIELIEKLNNLDLDKDKFYKILLRGKRNFEINIYSLYKYLQNEKILKIKDITKNNYDLTQIANEESLKGLFVKELLLKLEDETQNKEIIEKAIEIGLNAIEG